VKFDLLWDGFFAHCMSTCRRISAWPWVHMPSSASLWVIWHVTRVGNFGIWILTRRLFLMALSFMSWCSHFTNLHSLGLAPPQTVIHLLSPPLCCHPPSWTLCLLQLIYQNDCIHLLLSGPSHPTSNIIPHWKAHSHRSDP